MSENNFHTPPLPPKAPSIGEVSSFPVEKTAQENQKMDIKSAFHSIIQNKAMTILFAGTACAGLLLGALFFSGNGTTTQTKASGLNARIVRNPDLRENLRICGTVGPSYPCLLFIMNHSQNDRRAEDFFKEAEKLTGRQEFLIRIENKGYTQTRIPSGFIAQIKVPPMR